MSEVMTSQVVRINMSSSSFILKEHWTSESREAIIEEFIREERNYPVQGYGTSIFQIHEDPTGILWHAEFSRQTSCD